MLIGLLTTYKFVDHNNPIQNPKMGMGGENEILQPPLCPSYWKNLGLAPQIHYINLKVAQCKGSPRKIISNPAKFYFLFSSGVIFFLWYYKLDFNLYHIYGTIFNQFDFPICRFVNCVNFLGHISFSNPI